MSLATSLDVARIARVTNHFFVFKVQILDLIGQNIFHMKI
jgi:hypothetical protein